jgi:hypothetical protein
MAHHGTEVKLTALVHTSTSSSAFDILVCHQLNFLIGKNCRWEFLHPCTEVSGMPNLGASHVMSILLAWFAPSCIECA